MSDAKILANILNLSTFPEAEVIIKHSENQTESILPFNERLFVINTIGKSRKEQDVRSSVSRREDQIITNYSNTREIKRCHNNEI